LRGISIPGLAGFRLTVCARFLFGLAHLGERLLFLPDLRFCVEFSFAVFPITNAQTSQQGVALCLFVAEPGQISHGITDRFAALAFGFDLCGGFIEEALPMFRIDGFQVQASQFPFAGVEVGRKNQRARLLIVCSIFRFRRICSKGCCRFT